MPQKWLCRCGTRVPIASEYCGTCGTRWNKVHAGKVTNPSKQNKGTPVHQQDGPALAFSIPAVGLSSSGSSLAGTSQVSQQSAQTQKDYKTILHQRANRIGKIEGRIKRLESALQEIQSSWPQYVNQVQQTLQKEHQRCVDFHVKAHAEVAELKRELTTLMQPDGNVDIAMAPAYAQPLPTQPGVDAQAVQTALQVLKAAGMMPPIPTQATTAPMEAEATAAIPKEYQLPVLQGQGIMPTPVAPGLHLPVAATGSMPDASGVNPAHLTSTPRMQDHVLPPGNWAWPPSIPAATQMNFVLPLQQEETQNHNDVTATEPTPQSAVDANTYIYDAFVKTGVQMSELPVQHVVQQATEGLYTLHQQQGYPGGPILPQELQDMLNQFAQQQAACHAQMQQFQQQNAPPPATPTGGPVIPPESVSVASSPEKSHVPPALHAFPERFQMSPPGQRQPKVAKAVAGLSVHGQPVLPGGSNLPIPTSPGDTPHGTPVPTEVPSPSEHDQEDEKPVNGPGMTLQALE
eukprot:Skav221284  [mRNA]  locus=scaffold2775:203673:205223:+ [translate_table: standard]